MFFVQLQKRKTTSARIIQFFFQNVEPSFCMEHLFTDPHPKKTHLTGQQTTSSYGKTKNTGNPDNLLGGFDGSGPDKFSGINSTEGMDGVGKT